MAKKVNVFDKVLKAIARDYAPSLLELALPHAPVQVVGTLENVELVLPEERVDFIHRVTYGDEEYGAHIEFQLEHRDDIPERLFVYSGALTRQLGVQVMTAVFYLARRNAPIPNAYEVKIGDIVVNRFEYPVVKLWDYTDEIAQGRWPEFAPLLVTLVERTPDEATLARERELILQEEDPRKRANLLACAVTIGARYFDKEFLWKFFREEVEMIREATFVEDWLEEKLEEGFQQGLQQGLQQGHLASLHTFLEWRFGKVPLRLSEQLSRLTAKQLEPLVDEVLKAPDLETFQTVVNRLLSPSETDAVEKDNETKSQSNGATGDAAEPA